MKQNNTIWVGDDTGLLKKISLNFQTSAAEKPTEKKKSKPVKIKEDDEGSCDDASEDEGEKRRKRKKIYSEGGRAPLDDGMTEE